MVHFSTIVFAFITFGAAYGSLPQFYQNTLSNGINELQLRYKNLKFKEFYVKASEDEHSGIILRQLSNGKQLLTLIYNGTPFYYNSMHHTATPNLALKECMVEKGSPVNAYERQFEEMSFFDATDQNEENGTSIFSEKSLRNIAWEFDSLLKFRQLKIQCFQLHRKLRKSVHTGRNDGEIENSSKLLSRYRRGLEEVLILPGTKWCGSKRLARSYQDLDGHVSTDSCCRDHDMCPLSIPLLSKKYGLYNRYFTAISHCACDKRFRTCLKQAATGASDIVGKVFFNFVKSRCFVFKKKKTCVKYGLWNCFKWGYRKQAVMKDNLPW